MPEQHATHSKAEELLQKLELVGIVIALFSIGFSYALSESAQLEVSQQLNVTPSGEGWLYIHVKNTAIFKPTGNIALYRLEVNPNKPHLIINSLGPGANVTIALRINYTTIEVPLQSSVSPTGQVSCLIPAGKQFFVQEDYSISYRLACDHCGSEGVIERIPPTDYSAGQVFYNATSGQCTDRFPDYSWTQYTISDLSGNP